MTGSHSGLTGDKDSGRNVLYRMLSHFDVIETVIGLIGLIGGLLALLTLCTRHRVQSRARLLSERQTLISLTFLTVCDIGYSLVLIPSAFCGAHVRLNIHTTPGFCVFYFRLFPYLSSSFMRAAVTTIPVIFIFSYFRSSVYRMKLGKLIGVLTLVVSFLFNLPLLWMYDIRHVSVNVTDVTHGAELKHIADNVTWLGVWGDIKQDMQQPQTGSLLGAFLRNNSGIAVSSIDRDKNLDEKHISMIQIVAGSFQTNGAVREFFTHIWGTFYCALLLTLIVFASCCLCYFRRKNRRKPTRKTSQQEMTKSPEQVMRVGGIMVGLCVQYILLVCPLEIYNMYFTYNIDFNGQSDVVLRCLRILSSSSAMLRFPMYVILNPSLRQAAAGMFSLGCAGRLGGMTLVISEKGTTASRMTSRTRGFVGDSFIRRELDIICESSESFYQGDTSQV